jgi:hypothetical protein
MYNTDALESINREQLATATDRLLLRGYGSRRRPSTPSLAHCARGSQPNIQLAGYDHARGSQPSIPPAATGLAHGSQPNIQLAAYGHACGSQPNIAPATGVYLVPPSIPPTTVVRATRASRSQAFAFTVVIPTLVGIAVGLAAML